MISMMEFNPEREITDRRYLALIGRGLAAVPELAALLDDATLTKESVPLFGGLYSVADVAHLALSDIISGIPWLEFIPGDTAKRFEVCGYCVYWEFARESVKNRQHLKHSFLKWYETHAGDLVWNPESELVKKGSYVVKNRSGAPVKSRPTTP